MLESKLPGALVLVCALLCWMAAGPYASPAASPLPPAFPPDPRQILERTCFQTGQGWSSAGNLRSDVAIVYGIDPGLPERIRTWRDRGYRIHVMTGVSWGHYQDYLYGRFDGIHHEDEAQTDRQGRKISHGGDVYYMSPGTNYGRFLATGVQRALDAGVEAIHLEEPEFWVRAGYSEGFKREWRAYYGEDWKPPHDSLDAQWRASKLKYYLYRRALQQVFDHIQAFNARTGSKVRCYVPTHSLLNYAHWRIVSPESSLARLTGCDGYIAQVWTGTSRTPNQYRGKVRQRTFETAFLEYGAMQNLVRATGRTVWYLNDPIEDDPKHDWEDYRTNWESTLVASLLQPEVWQYEVAPWPERVFAGRYPAGSTNAQPIPPRYATELQVVCQALADLRQPQWEWDAGTPGIGVLVGDSLMFQRGGQLPGNPHLGEFYGLALPLLKRGLPIQPVQLENVVVPGYLRDVKVLVLSYTGMKPLTPDVHASLAQWVRDGGALVVCDDDGDPYHQVREWWNSDGRKFATPRQHLFQECSVPDAVWPARSEPDTNAVFRAVGRGGIHWLRENPVSVAISEDAEVRYSGLVRTAAVRAGLNWRETAHLLLRRGPYVVAAGLDETPYSPPPKWNGRFVNLFDPDLALRRELEVKPGSRWFLLDLDRLPPPSKPGAPRVLASACKALARSDDERAATWTVEGVGDTPAVVLIETAHPPREVTLAGQRLPDSAVEYSASDRLLRVRFTNTAGPRELELRWRE